MKEKLARYAGILLLVLLINTAYIAAFASPTIFYMGNVVLHLGLGMALAVMLLWLIRRMPLAGGLFLAASLAGVFLAVRGNTTPHRWVLEAHVMVAAAALVVLLPYVFRHTSVGFRNAYVTCLALLAIFPGASALYRKAYPDPNDRIRNPTSRAGFHGWGRRRPQVAVLSLIRQDQRRRHHSFELFHGFGGLRRVPQGYLRAVEELRAPLRVRSTTSSTGSPSSTCRRRIGHAAEQVVRRLPRSRGVLQWPLRPAHQGADRYARRRTPGSPARPATPSCTSTARWATPDSPSNIRRCTS